MASSGKATRWAPPARACSIRSLIAAALPARSPTVTFICASAIRRRLMPFKLGASELHGQSATRVGRQDHMADYEDEDDFDATTSNGRFDAIRERGREVFGGAAERGKERLYEAAERGRDRVAERLSSGA